MRIVKTGRNSNGRNSEHNCPQKLQQQEKQVMHHNRKIPFRANPLGLNLYIKHTNPCDDGHTASK